MSLDNLNPELRDQINPAPVKALIASIRIRTVHQNGEDEKTNGLRICRSSKIFLMENLLILVVLTNSRPSSESEWFVRTVRMRRTHRVLRRLRRRRPEVFEPLEDSIILIDHPRNTAEVGSNRIHGDVCRERHIVDVSGKDEPLPALCINIAGKAF